MIFGECRTSEAEGLILAHSLRLPGAMLKKGRVLSAADVQALREANINFVTGARLEPGDVGEDEAAAQVAAALTGEGVAASQAFTGRANLLAERRGLLVLDRDRLNRLNLVDEAVTVATLSPFDVVVPRQMVATVKIIPFGVDRRVVEACAAFASTGGPLIRVVPFRPHRVGLILTTLPGTKESVLTETVAATRARVEWLEGRLDHVQRCPHDVGSIERALTKALAAGCTMVLISGASATVDRRDSVPAAIERAGGAIDHFGMPVDPGNLLLLGHVGNVPVVDLPGCARSSRLNGLDWVLRRLAAGVPVAPRDIMCLGAGGLLKDIPLRPMPREEGRPPHAPRVAGIVLAAGRSSRMGRNKLVAELNCRPLVSHAVEAALEAGLEPVLVVTGHQAAEVEACLGGTAKAIRNPEPARGLASSLKLGLSNLPDETDAAVVLMGDMPRVTAAHVRRLVAAFDPLEGRAACVPVFNGQRGNPVLLGRSLFAEVAAVEGDQGARGVLAEHAESVCEVVMDDDAVLIDLDRPEDWERLA